MKKRKLFSLVAVSALLVACSQDEFVSVEGAKNMGLGNRPELGQVILNAPNQTRMDLFGSYNWTWATADKLGACIVDAVNPAAEVKGYGKKADGTYTSELTWTYAQYVNNEVKKVGDEEFSFYDTYVLSVDANNKLVTPEAFYTQNADNTISSNYPYVRSEAGAWTTPANLVEGNYAFYAPYNPSHLTRNPLQAVLPMIQDCSEDVMKSTKYKGEAATVSSTVLDKFFKGTLPRFENAPVVVAHSFLAAPEDRSEVIYPSVNMTDLYAYPMFTIVNNFDGYAFGSTNAGTEMSGTLTLDSVHIYTTVAASPLNYKTEIEVSKLKDDWEDDWADRFLASNGHTSKILATTAGTFDEFDYFDNQNKPQVELAGVTLPTYNPKHILCDLGGKELEKGKSYHFHAIMPAEDYGKTLYAAVFVTYGGKHYMIVTGDDIVTGTTAKTVATTGLGDFNFKDEKHGDEGVDLIRRQHYPKAELLENGTGTKAFAGTLLTINLTGGADQAALELKAERAPQEKYGFKNNEEFEAYMINNIQRGLNMKEDKSLVNTSMDDWTVTSGTAAFAFAEDTECKINAQLIKALRNRLYQGTNKGDLLTIDTNLSHEGDVVIASSATGTTADYTKYTFTTLDEEATSFDIEIKKATSTVGALNNGINSFTSATTGTLKVGEDVTGAVVILGTGADVTYNAKSTNISAIYVENGAKLTVESACSAMIIMKGGEIVMGQQGSLTNVNSKYTGGNIDNGNLRTIAGTVDGATITLASTVWPATAIPEATKINKITIDLTGELTIDNAQVAMLANLSGVAIELSANVTGIQSTANVTLSKIKSITSQTAGTNISWTKSGAGTATVSYEEPASGSFFTKIIEGTGITFVLAE